MTSFSVDDQGVTDYERKDEYGARVSYPILWTYSSLTPSIGVGAERVYEYYRGFNPAGDDLVNQSPFVPTADAELSFSNVETSRLAVAPEHGGTVTAGARLYSDTGNSRRTLKGAARATQYLGFWRHAVLIPTVKAMWTSGFDNLYGDADAKVLGRESGILPDLSEPLFDAFRIHGYPGRAFFSRAVGVGSLDLRVPVLPIFRGIGTYPLYFDQLYAFGRAELTYFPTARDVPTLPSASVGLTLTTQLLLNLPLSVTGRYDHGFRPQYGGKDDWSVALGIGSL
jgi:hypothetical protein